VVLVVVATVWTSLGLERAFADGRGWVVWGAIQFAALWRMLKPTADREAGIAESSLPVRLAATPGRLPEAVLCVVGLAFAVEAVRIAEPGLTVAAAGSLVTIGLVTAALRRRASGTASSGC
jgi:hypothetical protein